VQALAAAECEGWCRAQGIPALEAKFQFGQSGSGKLLITVPKAGLELVGLSNVITSAMHELTTAPILLWLTDWGMWSEQFDEVGIHIWERLLASNGIHTPIAAARGLLFGREESKDLRAHILLGLLFQWDFAILGESQDFTLFASHHGTLTAAYRSDVTATKLAQELGGWEPVRVGTK
jgi:hypothetical protein